MPFKSEEQRRYLWANEPEIARNWTDKYGNRIQRENGGIMRLGFKKGNDVDDDDDDDKWLFGQAKKGWDWSKQLPGMLLSALSGIPGLGFLLGAGKLSPIERYNRDRWSVHGKGISGTDHVTSTTPMDYYNTLRAGNLTGQDPFGVNVTSMFGNYQKHYEDYLNAFENQTKLPRMFGYVPSRTSQFAIDKANFARKVLGLEPDSPNIAGTPLVIQTSKHRSDKMDQPVGRRPDKPGGFTDPGKSSYGPHLAQGGLIDFYKNGGFSG